MKNTTPAKCPKCESSTVKVSRIRPGCCVEFLTVVNCENCSSPLGVFPHNPERDGQGKSPKCPQCGGASIKVCEEIASDGKSKQIIAVCAECDTLVDRLHNFSATNACIVK